MRILLTGGEGFIGSRLKPEGDITYASHGDFDITVEEDVIRMMDAFQPDLVVHLAALTDVLRAETAKDDYYTVNVLGTRNIAKHCNNLLYFSTEYVFDGTKGEYTEYDTPNPINFYGLTKLLGEQESRLAQNSVVLRTAVKPRPFRHAQVPRGGHTTGHYIDEMVPEYEKAINEYWRLPRTIHVGLDRISLKELALQTRKDCKEVDPDTLPVRIPVDSSLDTRMWKRIRGRYDTCS